MSRMKLNILFSKPISLLMMSVLLFGLFNIQAFSTPRLDDSHSRATVITWDEMRIPAASYLPKELMDLSSASRVQNSKSNLNQNSEDAMETIEHLLDGMRLMQALDDFSPASQESATENSLTSATAWNINDTKEFVAWNFDTQSYYTVNATLRAAAGRALIWVDDQKWLTNVTQEDANYLATTFTTYYPIITQFFGEPRDVDGDGVINVSILLTDLHDWAAGYFCDSCQDSNNLTMFYLDSEAGIEGTYDETLVHEYQHVIHANLDPDEDRWINEGASDFAVLVSGLLEDRGNWTWKVPYFEDNPGTSLTYWDFNSQDHDVRIDYAKSYLFLVYLAEHYGGDQFIQDLANNVNNGVTGVQSVLTAINGPTFQQVFNDWVIALYLDRLDVAGGRYGYQWLDLNMSHAGVISSNTTINGNLDDYGFAVYMLESGNASGVWSVNFNGAAATSFNVTMIPLFGNATDMSVSIPLDVNNDGTTTIPAFPRTALIVTRPDGSSGADGISPEKTFSVTINYLSTPELQLNDDVNITLQGSQLFVSDVVLLNGTSAVTQVDLAEVSVYDSKGKFSGIHGTLISDLSNSSKWLLATPLDVSLLPVGTYSVTVTMVTSGIAVTKSYPLIITTENTTYWTILLSDNLDGALNPNYDIRNVSVHVDYEVNEVTFRLSLSGNPDYGSYLTGYYLYFDVNNDSISDFVIFQSDHTGRVHSYLYDYNTSDYFPIETRVLGNSVLYTLSLSFFTDFQTVSVYGTTLRMSDKQTYDATDFAVVDLFGPPALIKTPNNQLEYYHGQVTSITLQWEALDNDPDSYLVLVNGTVNATGSWLSNDPIAFTLTSLSIGTYNITLVLNDTSGNIVTHQVLVKILPIPDTMPPTITGSSGTISITEGDATASLSWTIEDENPSFYTLYQNGTIVLNETWMFSPKTIEYPLDGLMSGSYEFNLTVHDIFGNTASVVIVVIVASSTTTTTTTTSNTSTISETTTTGNQQENQTLTSSTAHARTDADIPSVNTTSFGIVVAMLSFLGLFLSRLKKRWHS